ncbi:MAG: ABC transporter ATP-binding protein [Anaerolineae bacterium]|nr:ABC transporter ATP-binding protein [Anaerolineae bacterium]
MAEVKLQHIYKTYKGNVEAVKDLNLTIHDGEFLALLGPSGCGKSSTLRMLVGLEKITKGDLYIGDKVVNKLEPNQRNVALAFETYALYPPLKVRDNIAFCLRAKSVPAPEVDRRVREVAEILDIVDILDRKPGELGGGQKQRVSLARALVREPDVFLMDEPLSHLDAAQRAHMRVELKRLHATNRRTTVLVTHDQLEAVAMAERIAVMNLGVLHQVGTFDEIYNHPVNEFVAGFIGEPPMNFLSCEVVSDADKVILRAKDGSFKIMMPPASAQKLKTAGISAVKLGIRPIHLTATHSSSSASVAELEGAVHTYEALGEEGQLAVNVGQNQLLIVTDPHERFERGNKVWLQLRPDHIHLFNAETGITL